jgi:hypothetical protein
MIFFYGLIVIVKTIQPFDVLNIQCNDYIFKRTKIFKRLYGTIGLFMF